MNKSKRIIIVTLASLLSLLTIFLIFNGIQKWRMVKRESIMKIVTKIPDFAMFEGTKYYYTLYDNGDLEQIEEFELSEIESYDLYKYEERDEFGNIREQPEYIPPHTKEILKIIKDMGTRYLNGKFFIIDNRYYFTTYESGEYIDTLYEYFPESTSIKKLVSTERNHEIQYIEPY